MPRSKSVEKQTSKKYATRPSPAYPANDFCGKTKKGNDGKMWVSKPDVNGVCRWVHSAKSSTNKTTVKAKSRSKTKSRSRSKSPCPKGKILVHRKGYTRKDGTVVKASTFCIEDKGNPGKTSRGAKGSSHSGELPWIHNEGKLGGHGYLSKSDAERRKLLNKCVSEYGYRSCLASILVLYRNSEVRERYETKLDKDKKYLMKTFGKN